MRPAALALLLLAAPAAWAQSQRGAVAVEQWRDGLAEPRCSGAADRWRRHYAPSVRRMLGARDGGRLALFDHVSDALRDAGLPTEFALIPLIESDYRADARAASGPAGLWQFTAPTARNHRLKIAGGTDERLSPHASTRAAVRYLGLLHRMFGRDWRKTVMAYNAGDGAFRAAQRRGTGLSNITRAYPDKLHAIACLLLETAGVPAAAGGRRHVVVAGDSLSSVARRYRVPIARLMALNHLHPGSTLRPGQELAIPDSSAR